MKVFKAVLLIFVLIIGSGCSYYSGISGKVVDSVTGKPIEGAIVVAQWTAARGWLGEQQRELHKIVETLTDKEGKFSLSGTMGFALDPPEMIIYKEGYIPWRNDMVFPSCNIVKDHEWKNNVVYNLSTMTNKYTAEQLNQFMDSGIVGYGYAPMYNKIHNEVSYKSINESRTIRDNITK